MVLAHSRKVQDSGEFDHFVGSLSLIISIVGMLGVKSQEAYQLFWNTSGILYAFSYLVMFAIPIIGLKGHKADLAFG